VTLSILALETQDCHSMLGYIKIITVVGR